MARSLLAVAAALLLLALPTAARAESVLGVGEKPSILVDAAGTSHIVWNEQRDGTEPDITHYCRLPRGATACSNPNGTPMPMTGDYSTDTAGPKILQVGDQLVVLTHRYIPVVMHPDGVERDRTTYAWTSTDNGTTWTGPGIVGTVEPSGDAKVVGGADPKIAMISATKTGGTQEQTVDAGTFTADSATLGAGDDAYDGAIAPDGDAVVAAFARNTGGVTVRRVPAGGNANDANQWSTASLPGEELPRLAAGPSGDVLLTRRMADQAWLIRGVQAGNPAAALPITAGGQGQPRALFQDAAGSLYAATASAGSPVDVTLRTAAPGKGFSTTTVVATAGSVTDLALGAATDGGGVLTGVKDGGQVFVDAFGTGSPLPLVKDPEPPLPDGAQEGCTSAGFGVTKLTPLAGCLLKTKDPKYKDSLSASGTVDLNGLKLIPIGSAKILLDVRKKQLNTTGKVKIVLRGPAIGDIVLAERELHVDLGAKAGQSLFEGLSLPKGPEIKGFPIDASFDVKLEGDGVAIPLSLKLPKALLGLSAKATLRAKTKVGAVLSSFELRAPAIPLGPVSLRDLVVAYDGEGDTWTGGAGLKLPLGTLSASVTFKGGEFVKGAFNLPLGRPGINVFPQVFLTGVNGALGLQPFLVSAGATFGALYSPPPLDQYAAEILAKLTFTIVNGEAQLIFDGDAKLFGVPAGHEQAIVTSDGFAGIKGDFDLDLEAVRVKGAAQGFFNGPTKQLGITADVETSIAGFDVTGMKVALSNKGVGACVGLIDLPDLGIVDPPDSVAFGYAWNEPLPGAVDIFFPDNCDLSRYEIPRPPGRRLVPHQVPGGTPVTAPAKGNVELSGTTPPDVDVVLPDGSTVTPRSRANPEGDKRIFAVPVPSVGRTILVARDAPAGVWTLVPRAGSPAITGLRVAKATAPPKVTGKVRGRGARKTLSYGVKVPSGTTVRISEQWAGGGSRGLAVVAPGKRSGKVRLRFDRGPAGKRTVIAVPERGGIPGAPLTVTTYTAPPRQTLKAVRRLRAKGKGATWRRSGRPATLTVVARLRSGRTVARSLPGKATKVRFSSAVASVTVTPREVTGRAGKRASAKAPKAKRKPAKRRKRR